MIEELIVKKNEVAARRDVEIDQSPEIIQQLFKRNPPAGGNFVQIIYMNNISPDGTQRMSIEEVVKNVLVRLDRPRLENLKTLAFDVALQKHGGNKQKAADWLGVHMTTMYKKEGESLK